MQPPAGLSISRRERPAKPALTRDGIVASAVAIMRTEGLEQVTMRRLAQALDTGPASLYVYVRNTADLHGAVLDEMLGEVTLQPVPATAHWRERLVQVLFSYTTVLYEHPALARFAFVARPFGPHYLNLVEALLGLLTEGGVGPDRAAWGVDLLLLFATATAAEQATGAANNDMDALAGAVANVSPLSHPHIAALADELLSGPGHARLIWGLHVLISGIQQSERPRAQENT